MKTRIAALILACMLPTYAGAWTETGSFYLGALTSVQLGDICDSVRFPLTPGDCSGAAGNPDWRAEVGEALNRWANVTPNFQYFVDAEAGATFPGDCDNADPNSTFFLDDICGFAAFDGSTLAVALTSFFLDGVSLHSDVVFNTAWDWNAFDDAMTNHPGEIDFRRVAVHEFGHVMGLGHASHQNAIMAPFIQNVVNTPLPDDVAGLSAIYGATIAFSIPDQNGNSTDELVHIRRTPAGAIQATIRDGGNSALYRSMSFFSAGYQPVDAVLIPDEDGSGQPELAVLALRLSDLRAVVQIRNIAGAESPRTITWAEDLTPIKMVNIGDADGNGVSELAVLTIRETDLLTVVQTRNSFGNALQRNIYFSEFASPIDLKVILDPLEVAPPRLVVLSKDWFDQGRGVVEQRNAIGLTNKKRFFIRALVTPISLAIVNHTTPHISVLAVRDLDGRTLVETRDAAGLTERTTQYFLKGYTPAGLTSIDDADNDGLPELAVVSTRDVDGRVNVQIRNLDGTDAQSFNFPANFDPPGSIFVTGDVDGSGFPEVAVLMSRQTDARVRVDATNAAGAGAGSISSVWISPP